MVLFGNTLFVVIEKYFFDNKPTKTEVNIYQSYRWAEHIRKIRKRFSENKNPAQSLSYIVTERKLEGDKYYTEKILEEDTIL